MTVVDYLQERGALDIFPLTDAAGSSTAVNVGTRAAAATEMNSGVSRNAFGASGIVSGLSTCWQGSGSEARGFQVAAAATAALQLQTYTIGVFARLSGTVTANFLALGRQNGWQLIPTTTGKLNAKSGVTGEAVRANPTTPTVGVTVFWVMTYDGYAMQPWVNGERDGLYTRIVGTLGSFPNRVVVGGDTGMLAANLKLSCAFIDDRVWDEGEIVEAYQQGRPDTRPTADAVDDFTGDSLAAIAAGAEGTRCMGCGGRRRTREATLDANGVMARRWHPHCYGGNAAWQATLAQPTNSSSELAWDAYLAQLIWKVQRSYTRRPSTDTVRYEADSGQLMWTGQASTFGQANYGAILTARGILHRRTGGGRYSWYLERVKRTMTFLRSRQIPQGQNGHGYFSEDLTNATSWGVNHIFTVREAMAGIIAVWPDLDTATRAEWQTTLERAIGGDWDYQGPDSSGAYYANGNIVLNQWACARMLYHLTGSELWNRRQEAWLAHCFAPSTGGRGPSTGLAQLGLKAYTDGTATDARISEADLMALSDTSGTAYLTEGNSNNPAGQDWNYTGAQADIASNVYEVTGDLRARKMMHVFTNLVWPKQNLTTGTVGTVPPFYADNRNGTRHNAIEIGVATTGYLHGMRRQGRADLATATQCANQIPFMEADAMLNTTNQGSWYRSLTSLSLAITAGPGWPGFPEVS